MESFHLNKWQVLGRKTLIQVCYYLCSLCRSYVARWVHNTRLATGRHVCQQPNVFGIKRSCWLDSILKCLRRVWILLVRLYKRVSVYTYLQDHRLLTQLGFELRCSNPMRKQRLFPRNGRVGIVPLLSRKGSRWSWHYEGCTK